MTQLNDLEFWRQIPPEEKLEMMSRAQARGVSACLLTILITWTCAIALELPMLIWIGLFAAPLIFQFNSGKAWRAYRPATMLQYLAARTASRRYAFSRGAKELSALIIFKGQIERVYDADAELEEALEARARREEPVDVWITLFPDMLTIIKEAPGGADLVFWSRVVDKLSVSGGPNETSEYSSKKELFLRNTQAGKDEQFKITSRYPAALIVLQKKYEMALRGENKKQREKNEASKKRQPQSDDDSEFRSSFGDD